MLSKLVKGCLCIPSFGLNDLFSATQSESGVGVGDTVSFEEVQTCGSGVKTTYTQSGILRSWRWHNDRTFSSLVLVLS